MTNPLPFAPDKFDLIAGEETKIVNQIMDDAVETGVSLGNEMFQDFQDFLADDDGLSRSLLMLHFWHKISHYLIRGGMSVEDLTITLRKVRREVKKQKRIQNFIEKQG